MVPAASNSIWYVYGIVPAELSSAALPQGIDDAGVSIEPRDGIAALVSVLDGSSYAADAVEASSGNVDWLSPRAVAHDLVLTWASDHGAVIPLPMFSMFSSRDAVCDMLRDRAPRLAETLVRVGADGAREYALRVYRLDAELMESVTALSPRLSEMAATAAAASPGQRYLLERKLEGEKKIEMRDVGRRLVEEIFGALEGYARESVRSPIPRSSAADAARGAMVLNAAFLVAANRLDDFKRALTAIVDRHASHGFRFDFTGPWPPYHFVGEAGHGA